MPDWLTFRLQHNDKSETKKPPGTSCRAANGGLVSPIPKFAPFCGTLVCELRNRRILASIGLVWLLDQKSACWTRGKNGADFLTATLESILVLANLGEDVPSGLACAADLLCELGNVGAQEGIRGLFV